jgi:hypothetical protein
MCNLNVPQRLIEYNQETNLHGMKDVPELQLWLSFVYRTIQYQATDPRDHLYSKLGLAGGTAVAPDYSRSVEEVYCDFARISLSANKNLSFLRFAGFGNYTDAQHPYHLFVPSWAPNWDTRSKAGNIDHELGTIEGWCADGAMRARVESGFWSIEGYRLKARGLIFEEVNDLVSVQFKTDYDYLDFCIQYLASNKDKLYPTGILVQQALFRAGFLDMDKKQPWGQSITPLLAQLDIMDNVEPRWREVFLDSLSSSSAVTHVDQDEVAKQLVSSERRIGLTWACFIRRTMLRLNWSLFFTSTGYIGWVPRGTQRNDLICVILGCDTPVVLRKVGPHYIHIGPCWVLGIMAGEAVEGIQVDSEKILHFTIC